MSATIVFSSKAPSYLGLVCEGQVARDRHDQAADQARQRRNVGDSRKSIASRAETSVGR